MGIIVVMYGVVLGTEGMGSESYCSLCLRPGESLGMRGVVPLH